jgi:hypothetical protein
MTFLKFITYVFLLLAPYLANTQTTFHQKKIDSVGITVIYQKKIDSLDIIVKRDGDYVAFLLVTKEKTDTILTNNGIQTVAKVCDIKMFGNKFVLVYEGYPLVEYIEKEWDGSSWQKIGTSGYVTSRGMNSYDPSALSYEVEILDYNKVRLVQKGETSIITYDTETGIELSRTVEKQ